jgi:hypothetical protein
MNLKDFIYGTLCSIVEAVDDGKEKHGDKIARKISVGEGHPIDGFVYEKGNLTAVFMVDFDVAVTASQEADGEINGGIKVLDMGFGSKASGKINDTSVSRIRFKIPIRITPKN